MNHLLRICVFVLSCMGLLAGEVTHEARSGQTQTGDASVIPYSRLMKMPVYQSMAEAMVEPESVLRLNLSKPPIDSLSAEVGQLVSLRELVLRNHQLTALPDEIGNLVLLQTLDLSQPKHPNEGFKALPESVYKLENLLYVNLIGLPSLDWKVTLGGLANLKKLDNLVLLNNRLVQLPEEVTGIKSLNKLWLGKNPDLDLVDTFTKLSKLPNLQQLGLASNGHGSLPKEVNQLVHLVNLHLGGNHFTEVPDLSGLPQLKQLTLDDSSQKILGDSLLALKSLEYLSLNNMPGLDFVEAFEKMAQLPELDRLSLQSNKLKTVPSGLLKLKGLVKLNLEDNQIEDPSSLAQLTNLKNLVLRDNPIPMDVLNALRAQLPDTRIIY